ncbi:MAG: signal peptidase I [Acidimicrobiia bacterium]|nr:signal peptidase I [Acidimicrobiia bacterium]
MASHRRDRRIKSRNRALAEWVFAIALAVVAALAIKTWLVQAFIIPSQSMERTLEVGDRVLVAKFAYKVSDISRSDVVVFKNPDRLPGEPAQLIKRVVGLPGDVLEAVDGHLVRNGAQVDESYLRAGVTTTDLPRTVVPEDHLFVMGDNRANSRDSRFIGPVPEDLVVGKAFFRIWPPGRIGGL